MSVLKSLFTYAGKHKYLTILSLLLSSNSAILLIMPFIWIWKVVQVLLEVYPDYTQIESATQYGLYALYFALAGIIVYVIGLLCSHLAAFRIASNMRKAALHHLVTLPLGYFSKEGSGKLRKIIDESAASTETFLAHQLPDTAQLFTTVIVVLICLFIFDWKFAVAALIPMFLALTNMFKMMGPSLHQSMKAYMDALETMSNEAVEYVRGIPVVKTFQQTVFTFERFHKAIKSYEKFAIDYTNRMRIPMTLFTTFVNCIFIFLIGLVIILILNGFDLNSIMPDFMFYVIFTPILSVTTNKIMYASENSMMAKDALSRIESIINEDSFVYAQNINEIKDCDIVFENVSFKYPGSENEVLHDVNLNIKAGSTIAFVGKSGGGKTTLVSLIPRFYDVTKGAIKIGGIDVKNISEKELMNKISFVFQDSRLLKKSLYENVKMGYDVSEEEITKAIHKAQCDDIVEKFDLGVHTKIGSKGVYLSGGETQRMTLARAIVKDSPILLLDEASAYADSDNEILMQKAIMELSKNKTTIMIAHRLSTIVNVDCIYVVDNGRIIESGTHDELLKAKGLYSDMWREYSSSIDWKVGA